MLSKAEDAAGKENVSNVGYYKNEKRLLFQVEQQPFFQSYKLIIQMPKFINREDSKYFTKQRIHIRPELLLQYQRLQFHLP